MKRPVLITLIVIVLLAAGGTGWYFLAGAPTPPADTRQVLYWTDPMVPGYRSDKPGKSPFMDMELVPVYADESPVSGAPAVSATPETVQKLAVRTLVIRRAPAQHRLIATGYLFGEHSALLVIADVFERDTQWLRAGLAAEARIAGIPDARFPAQVERVVTDRDIGGRSVKLHARLLRHDARLQANLPVELAVHAPAGQRLLVPREAIIRTEQRTVVIRVLDDGRFQPADVVPGGEFGELTEIRQGLRDDEKIVVSGQFLFDSESSVRENLKRMDADSAPTPHSH
jgi:Cu(I)/Ag(I) efflux system membrane fusion protein